MATISIAGVTYEVYGSLASANAYFAAAIQGAPWASADSSVRSQALVTATRVFERTGWQGAPTDTVVPVPPATLPLAAGEQALEWPRTGLVDMNGVAVDSTAIPQDVIDGNFEYALAVINDATVQTSAQTGSNLKIDETTERVEGAITVTTKQQFFRSTLGKNGQFPTIVQDYIGQWLASTKAAVGIFAGGTDVESQSNQDFCYISPGIP